MAPLSEAYKCISPYPDTQVFSYETQQLLQSGYQNISTLSEEDQVLIRELQDTLGKIKTFWWERLRFVGIDNKGRIPPFFIHFQNDNAYYHPKRLKIPEHFAFNNQYVHSPEVVAHEFTHGVIEWLNPLGNAGEAGAINESVADIVGIVFKRNLTDQYGQKRFTDWKINTFRDLSTSTTVQALLDTTPKFDSEGKTTNDMGNVHHNSTVLSHAFYLAANELGKFDESNQQLLNIWISAVRSLQKDEKFFGGFIRKTINIGFQQNGLPFEKAIKSAWIKIGFSSLFIPSTSVANVNQQRQPNITNNSRNQPHRNNKRTEAALVSTSAAVGVVALAAIIAFIFISSKEKQ